MKQLSRQDMKRPRIDRNRLPGGATRFTALGALLSSFLRGFARRSMFADHFRQLCDASKALMPFAADREKLYLQGLVEQKRCGKPWQSRFRPRLAMPRASSKHIRSSNDLLSCV